MSPALRFLGLAVVGWVGLRAAMLGAIPGGELFHFGSAPPESPPIVATEFPPLAPLAPAGPALDPWLAASGAPAYAYYPVPPPRVYYVSSPPSAAYREAGWPQSSAPLVRAVAPAFYASVPQLDEWPLSRLAAASSFPLGMAPPRAQSVPTTTARSAVVEPAKLDRIQLTTWALLRGTQGQTSSTDSLASGSTLGGSQAGARIAYQFTPQVAATLRTTSTVGRSGGEVALGARIQPVRGLPLWVTAERRQRLGRYGGGRNAFALFFEGGLWDRPLPMDFRLDAYLQGGVVGFNSRDAFIDGAVTATRPVYRNFSAGL
ncbi:MAG: hypothetical protein ABIS39_00530, partial [Sphingomicrobium sp.]